MEKEPQFGCFCGIRRGVYAVPLMVKDFSRTVISLIRILASAAILVVKSSSVKGSSRDGRADIPIVEQLTSC